MPSFRITSGADAGNVLSLEKSTLFIGRSLENDIVLNDSAVSRSHAKIVCRKGRYFIRDLGSTHGTFVNEVRDNHELLLADGDRVRVGATEMVFEATASEADSPPPPEPGPTSEDVSLDEAIAYSMPAEISTIGTGLSDKHAEMLSRVADAIRSVFEIDALLTTLMDAVFEVLQPERGAILLLDEDSGVLRFKIKRPASEEIVVSQTIIDYALRERMSLLVSDTAEDQRFSAAKSIMSESILSAICAPLVLKDRVLGVLYIDTQSHFIRYHKDDLALLNIIAANTAIAIENARLVEERINTQRLAAIGLTVAGVSHYIKNIMTGIKGSADLIDHAIDKRNIDLVTKIWPTLKRSNEKLAELCRDMLNYSRRGELSRRPCDINAIIEEIADSQRERCRLADVELILELDDDLPNCEVDPGPFCDAVLNLLTNAVEACQETPDAQVRLRTMESADVPGAVAVMVQDNGPGIPDEARDKIFQPFYTSKAAQGTGLGLALTLKAAEEHGGRIAVDSQPGEGTVFTLLLPVGGDERIPPLDEPA